MPLIHRFSEDIEFMTGRRTNIFWRVCWMGISPVMLVVVLVAYVVVQVQVHPEYPVWNPQYVRAQHRNPNTTQHLIRPLSLKGDCINTIAAKAALAD